MLLTWTVFYISPLHYSPLLPKGESRRQACLDLLDGGLGLYLRALQPNGAAAGSASLERSFKSAVLGMARLAQGAVQVGAQDLEARLQVQGINRARL